MDIGTAKPDSEFLSRYPHYLIDIREPSHTYSAADFAGDAKALIDEIHQRGKIPLLVGGTMFYFKALQSGLSDLPATDAGVRRAVDQTILVNGLDVVYQQLQSLDPQTAKRIDPHDRQRIQRAMEIHQLSGKPPSALMQAVNPLPHPLVKLTLFDADRAALHRRIRQRFLSMIEQGLVKEVSALSEYLTDYKREIAHLPCMRIVGYRQVYDFLQDKLSFDLMIEKAVAATRQLAKRQLTWLRQQSNVVWFQAGRHDASASISGYLDNHPLMKR